MIKRLYRFTPHFRLLQNPLFALEARRVRWGGSAQNLLHASGQWLLIVCGVALVLWAVLNVGARGQYDSSDLLAILFALSLLAALVLDYTCMSAALNTINGEVSSGRWDLLRLSLLRSEQIIAAKHGAAQVRAWRSMVLLLSARVSITLIALLASLLVLTQKVGRTNISSADAMTAIIGQVIIVVISVMYIVEPFWRMRTVTALGVAISSHARQQASSVAAAVGVVAALWLVQGLIAAAIGLLVTLFILPTALLESSVNQLVFCSPLMFVALFVGTIYGFYSVVQTWSLRHAERTITRVI